MKNLMLFALLLISVIGFVQTASAVASVKPDVAVAAFDAQNFNFGKIKQGVPATHEFSFTNRSNVPMVITNVQASCGCTTPDWSREAILPGGKGFVKATYNAANAGNFDKSITVMANVEGGTVVLRIHGEVAP